MESSSGCSVWFRHRHRGHPEDTGGGFSERGEDFYPAIREDIQLATREDFFMAMDIEEALIKLEAAQLSPAQQHTEYWKIQASLVTNWWLLANGLAKTRTSGGFVLMMRPYNCRS